MPGDSVVLPMPDLTIVDQAHGVGGITTPTYKQCFWLTLPNDSLDAVVENNSACATLKTKVNAQNPSINNACLITPNPVHQDVHISWSGSGGATVQIFDLNGRGIAQKYEKDNYAEWQAEDWPAGLYHVLVRSDEGELFWGKWIKI
jgi:hypothetical protein